MERIRAYFNCMRTGSNAERIWLTAQWTFLLGSYLRRQVFILGLWFIL